MPESPPQVNAFVLCDQAFQQAYTGKWCIIGTFGVIWARAFPVVHSPLVAFIGLSDFSGNTLVEVHVRQPTGELLTAVKAQIPPIPSPTAEFALPFPPLTFPDKGAYTLELHAGGQILAARSFRVELAPQNPATPPAWPGTQPNPPSDN